MTRTRWAGLLVAIAVLVALFWSTRGPAATSVDVGTVTRRATFESTVSASGEIAATRSTEVGASAFGRIVKLNVAEGDQVRQGQLVAEIDNVQASSELAAAAAQVLVLQADERAALQQVQAAQSDREAAAARAQDAVRTAERTASLFRQGLATASARDETRAAADAAQAQLSAAHELADKLARNPEITDGDARFLARWSAGRVLYAPTAQQPADISAGGLTFENAIVNGTASTLFDIRVVELEQGRFISAGEDERSASVVVIGWDVANTLFPGSTALGRTIRIARRGFRVIGVQARQGTTGGLSLDRYVWMPLGAYARAFGAPGSLQIFAKAAPGTTTAAAEDHARTTMRARRHLAPGSADDFDLLTPEAARTFVFTLSERVGAAGPPLFFMALLAAVLVVTNTALVSVTARTREIGILRAVGATRRRIVAEVLTEALLIGLAGGLAGLAGAAIVLHFAQGPIGLSLPLTWTTIGWSLGAALVSGLAAGWYPARVAAHVEIIDALHAE